MPFLHQSFWLRLRRVGKDLEKLMLEPVNGFWFHTLEGIDSETISRLWAVMRREMKDIGRCVEAIAPKHVTIHFCVLRERLSLERTIRLEQDKCRAEEWLDNLVAPDFSRSRVTSAGGWLIRSGRGAMQ